MIMGLFARLFGRSKNLISDGRNQVEGPTGLVPLSSARVNAELIDRAMSKLETVDKREVEAILTALKSNNHYQALSGIRRQFPRHTDPDVRAFLLWTRSNIFHHTAQIAEEVATLQILQTIQARPIFMLNLAIANARLEKFDQAETAYHDAINLAQGFYPLARYNLGIMYCRLNRKDDAREQFNILNEQSQDVPPQLLEKLKRRISELA
jgi:tetratricopeptide (TPR) repeat protein